MNKKLLPWLITFCALGLGGTAAYYSIIGLSKLFAGVATAVIIMASFLEMSKLTLATLLHSYWDKLNILSKIYYITSLVILSLLTSAGIYGMLSSGYQETANKAGNIDSQIALVEVKRDNVKEQLAVYNTEKTSINEAITNLRSGLSNNKIQYKDRETGQIITTTSTSTRKALEKQLDQAIERQTEINAKVDDLNEQLFEYETEIVKIKTGTDLAGELGPLKYLSGLTGTPMDKIINILLLTIIFVFDPLAIALVIAANYAFEQLKNKTRENIYGEEVVVEDGDSGMWTEEEMQDFNEQFNADDMLPDEEEEDWEVVDEEEDPPNEVLKQSAEKYKETINQPLPPHLNPNLSAWARNKALQEWKRKNSNDDLTKTY